LRCVQLKEVSKGEKTGFVISVPPPKGKEGEKPSEVVFVINNEAEAANWLNDLRQTRVKAATSRVKGQISAWTQNNPTSSTPTSATVTPLAGTTPSQV
jgi:hypothetical protein